MPRHGLLSTPSGQAMFSIGAFSKVTGLTIKTLRYYHEEGLLAPRFVDPSSGYRYYDPAQAETARTITYLRSLELSVADIKQILADRHDDEELVQLLERHKSLLQAKVKQFRTALRAVEQFLAEEKAAREAPQTAFEIEEKSLPPLLVAGVRMKGRYSDCGQGFRQIGRNLGRYIAGAPFLLHYDDEYREADAEFEACMPLKAARQVDGIAVRELPAVRCVSLVHRGRYETLGHAYARVLHYVKDRAYTIIMPTREVYLKGPGMIFRGNARRYLTEVQIPVASTE